MTYSITITMTRPNNSMTFLPHDPNAQTAQVSRKAAAGYIREERTMNGNVMTISHVWDTKAAFDTFEQANKVALEQIRATRDAYFTANNIAHSSSWVDE